VPKPRLLIVEDECIVAADIAASLSQMGYEVAGTTDCGETALAMAKEIPLNLVLMDIHVRGPMDGIETACVLRERFNLPVVFLSAYGEDDTLQRAKQADSYGYVLKPFEDRELRIVIEMALYKHRSETALREKLSELERFTKVTVDRELRMLDLKREINELLVAAGKPERYRITHES